MGRMFGAASVLLLAACSGSATLVIQVRTDLLPVRELVAIEVRVIPPVGGERVVVTAATRDRDWAGGVRVAELGNLTTGVYRALVTAVDEGGATIVERPVRVELGGGVRVVTVLLTRDCQGVRCPYEDGDPTFTGCLAGRCVREGCAEESPELCGVPECASDAECPAVADECASARCTDSGACLPALDHTGCGADELCSPLLGCTQESCGWNAFENPTPLDDVNTPREEYGPTMTGDGLELFFTSTYSDSQIHASRRDDRSLPFPAGAPSGVLESARNTEPSVSSDGLRVYFASSDAATRRLYVASRASRAAPFVTAPLDYVSTGLEFESGPDLSADERILVFCAGPNSSDLRLFVAARASTSEGFGTPAEVTGLEPSGTQSYPSISADGLTLYYQADGATSRTIWVARRATRDDPFVGAQPVNGLAGPLYPGDVDISFDGLEMVFNLADTFEASPDLYIASRVCAP